MPEFRGVGLGSRQGPDPVDHFLEEHLLYRKHTVRDPTSLFRVVAEQVYDTQVLHYEVRMECVRFMFRKRRLFERQVRGDFDDYLWRLEKTQTEGTMLELRAMCLLYGRNVVIYETFQLGETVTIGDIRYQQDVLRIFKDYSGHFDTVFTMPEIAMAAVCQAISYKLLYQQLFRLPDVGLAVEAMLYPNTFNQEMQFEMDADRNVIGLLCYNGRTFKLDRPEKTRCLLTNYKTCAYHNRRPNSPVPISCVRQFVADERAPFPYAVSKSLDPYTYRNVELYCLNAARRQARNLNIYMGDYDFKVGAKCQVALDPKQPRKMSICHIQYINWEHTSSVVFSEAKAQFLTVPYSALHPMPPSEFQPWDPPYRYRRPRHKKRPKKVSTKEQQVDKRPGPALHSEAKKVTLPFSLAMDHNENKPKQLPLLPPPSSDRENHSISMPSNQRAAPAAMPVLRPPMPIPRQPLHIPRPPLPTVPQPVFYPTPPQQAIGSHQFMPGQFPFQPHMIRAPVRFYLMPTPPPPPGDPGTMPGLMPPPFVGNIPPMVAQTFNDFHPLTY
nr:protein ovarian tumor locus [Drosophila kikkawai]